jgi:hypothetical protein
MDLMTYLSHKPHKLYSPKGEESLSVQGCDSLSCSGSLFYIKAKSLAHITRNITPRQKPAEISNQKALIAFV